MKEKLSAAGSVLAAVFASACCWGPLLLAGLGASGAGFAAALAPWRPYLMAATLVFLAAAWYFTLRKTPAAAASSRIGAGPAGDACFAQGGCCPPDGRRRRGILVLSAVAAFVLVMLAFPQISIVLVESGSAQRAPALNRRVAAGPVETASLTIQGMTCEACGTELRRELLKAPWVAAADVDYHAATARVTFERGKVSETPLRQAVARTGYRLTRVHVANRRGKVRPSPSSDSLSSAE